MRVYGLSSFKDSSYSPGSPTDGLAFIAARSILCLLTPLQVQCQRGRLLSSGGRGGGAPDDARHGAQLQHHHRAGHWHALPFLPISE